MPPQAFLGVVTKAGVMNKTVTVTVERVQMHMKTHKVCDITSSMRSVR